MRGYLMLAAGLAMLGAGQAKAQAPVGEPACKPCWIEPWYCKAPPCPPMPAPPAPEPDVEPARPPLVHVTLTGIVTSLGIVQEEPGQTPQATFYLAVVGADGERRTVLIDIPEPRFPCGEGDRATLDGDVPADEQSAPTILLRARVISCR